VQVTVGGTTTTHAAPAGVFAILVPLAPGDIKVIATRGHSIVGMVASPFTVQSGPEVQDLEYFAVSSLRSNTR
jgi:hypothetical protein